MSFIIIWCQGIYETYVQMDATTPNFVGIAKSLTSFKLCATSPNNMQQGVQTEATYNIQQCWVRLQEA